MKQQIKNFENYTIYDTGEVFNENTGKKLEGKIRLNGYRVYSLSKNNKKQDFYAHRLVAEYFINNPNNLPVVNHKDGNKLNNSIENLEWVSYSDNALHAYKEDLIQKRTKAIYYTEDLNEEEWKQYKNYFVSNYGRIRNASTNRLLKPSKVCGYLKVRLSNNGIVEDITVHKLVFTIFNPSTSVPEGYVIDHIDGDKTNNHINNLRCVSNQENALLALYATQTNKSVKPVEQYDLQGNYIQSFPSQREAARQLGLDSSSLSKACRGKVKTCGGFVFKYKTI